MHVPNVISSTGEEKAKVSVFMNMYIPVGEKANKQARNKQAYSERDEFSRPEFWSAFPFSRGYFHPRDRTRISHIAGGFFTSWATR